MQLKKEVKYLYSRYIQFYSKYKNPQHKLWALKNIYIFLYYNEAEYSNKSTIFVE